MTADGFDAATLARMSAEGVSLDAGRAVVEGVEELAKRTEENLLQAHGARLRKLQSGQALEEETERERNKREARRIVDREERPAAEFPAALTLKEILAQPPDPVRWRVEGWLPAGGRVVFAGPAKSGKTHVSLNMVRCLVDGARWLDRDPVTQVTGTVVVIDFEMTERQLYEWYRDAGIAAAERVVVLPMRGRAAAFDLRDEELRRRWAALLVELGAEFVVWDCLRPVLDALGLDENHDASALLTAFDAMLADAGRPEALVVHHMGHGAERARGDSGIIGWGDANWKLVLEGGDELGPRYLSAVGRDVAQAEVQVALDPATRRLTVVGGTRAAAKRSAASDALVAVLQEAEEPLTTRDIEAALDARGVPRATGRDALKALKALNWIAVEPGPNRSLLHSLRPECAGVPECADGVPAHQCAGVPPPYRAAHAHTTGETKEEESERHTEVGEQRSEANPLGEPPPEQLAVLERLKRGEPDPDDERPADDVTSSGVHSANV